jgi:four helix bundle protein
MTAPEPSDERFPHHRLVAYQLALELLKLVARTRVANAELRQQARKSAASSALNSAQGAARQTLADKSRADSFALCEACEGCEGCEDCEACEGCEACAAVAIAGALGACSAAEVRAALELGVRAKNVLSRLVR